MIRRSTRLPLPAGSAWELAKRSDTFLYVVRGLLGVRVLGGAELPERWRAGDAVQLRLLIGGVIPANRHELRVVEVDDERRVARTNEHGGLLRAWNHRISVAPEGEAASRYTDEVEVRAGPLTPLVWAGGHLFFAYRQRRLRRLARTLLSD